MTLRYRDIEKPRSIMGVTPAYSPMNDFHAGTGRFITDNDLATAARVVVLGTERAQEFFGSDDPDRQDACPSTAPATSSSA